MRFEEYLITRKKELFPDDLSEIAVDFINQNHDEDDFIEFIEQLDILEQVSPDGYGELFVNRKGKFLIIHPPKFRGEKTSCNQVLEMLQQKGISNLNKEKNSKINRSQKENFFFY